MSPRPISILLVEDDDEDIYLTEEALHASKLVIQLDIVKNGEDAIKYLHREAPYGDKMLPDLIILDLNLPKKNGWEVLETIKSNATLRTLPVTILTTSSEDPDVRRAYDMGANSYITKPIGLEAFRSVVHTLEDFWFTIVKLPPKPTR
ncbi:MAG: response regulator [Nitrospirales bacterium]|nr:response regulator [Nitrospira sp.]MDR4503078.1 response regulator [Nitrospirales bacterium]